MSSKNQTVEINTLDRQIDDLCHKIFTVNQKACECQDLQKTVGAIEIHNAIRKVKVRFIMRQEALRDMLRSIMKDRDQLEEEFLAFKDRMKIEETVN